jgi:hypothetical protein
VLILNSHYRLVGEPYPMALTLVPLVKDDFGADVLSFRVRISLTAALQVIKRNIESFLDD